MFCKAKNCKKFNLLDAQKVLGDDLYFDLMEIEDETMLDKTIFGYFNKYHKLNRVISKHGLFLKFLERRNMYRFLIKKKVQRKSEVTRNLSACVVEKFNGYETIRNDLAKKDKREFKAIDTVYDPSCEKDNPVLCYFTPNIHLAYKNYVGHMEKGREKTYNRSVKQCHYCQNYFLKSVDKMQKHLSIYAAKEGVTYFFDNGQIIDYQDNFKYIGDLPFSVYFDFETTTGNAVFFDSKLFVISYCMVFTVNKTLNFDKIVIFRSFQQRINELDDISYFKNEHVPFFDGALLGQLKDAASDVANRKKCTSLAEMFSIELKFIIDTLKGWFDKLIKPKFFELDFDKKQYWKKHNPLTDSTACSICDFPLDPYGDNGWFEHVAKSEHLFLRNIYSAEEMKQMGINNFSEYKYDLISMLDIVGEFEDALQDGEPGENVINFINLDQFASTFLT